MVSSPDRDNTLDYAHICGAPFHVIVLQQTWREGQLVIDIGIINRAIQEFQTKTQGMFHIDFTAVKFNNMPPLFTVQNPCARLVID